MRKVIGARNQLAQIAHHLAAVAHAERESIGAREERRGGEEDADRHGSDGSAWRVPSGARHRMLRAMWVFPLVAAAVAGLLLR